MSGFVPGFEHDLFLSYAHADDQAWIEAFQRSLREELARRLGLPVAAWQDGLKLRAGQNWHSEIEAGVRSAAVFVAILSPSYENSDWCTRERGLFRELFPSQEAFEGSQRVFLIVKMPWEGDAQRQFLSRVQAIDFFRREEGPAGDLELLPGTDEFRKAVGALAQAIAPTLRRLRCERERVFVASPAQDCLEAWRQVCAELRDRGYDIQPPGRRDEAFADGLLRDEMVGALVSVHLLGAEHDSFVERQVRLAADLDLRLLFWLDPSLAGRVEADQVRLLELLADGQRPDRPGARLPSGWALLRELNLRSFIEEVLAALGPKPPAPPPLAVAEGALSTIYIVHDATTAEDTRIATELREQIVEREGMGVFLSRADLPTATDRRQRHERLLETCEGVLLCSNRAPKDWLMEVAQEVIYADRLLKRRPFKSRAFLVADTAPWQKVPNLRAIPYGPQFQLGDLEPFLAPLRNSGGAAHGV